MVFIGRNIHYSHCYKTKQICNLQNATNCYQPKQICINKLNQMIWKITHGFMICYEGNTFTRRPFEAPKIKSFGGKPLKTGVDVIGFIWPITLEKLLQIGIFGTLLNFQRICKICYLSSLHTDNKS